MQCPCARLVTLHSNSCPVARYNNLPEEIRERHVKDKSNAAYILGWSERSVSGRTTSTSASCFNTPRIQSYTMHTALHSILQLMLHSVCNGSNHTATQHMLHGCRCDTDTPADLRTYTHPCMHCTALHTLTVCQTRKQQGALLRLHTQWMVLADGRLTHGMLMGYDNPRMEGLWPSEEECPGFK